MNKYTKTTPSFHIAHLNCKAIYSRLAELKNYINSTMVDVVCFSETWLSNKEPNIPHYNSYWKHRDRNGGGVGISVNASLSSRAFNL